MGYCPTYLPWSQLYQRPPEINPQGIYADYLMFACLAPWPINLVTGVPHGDGPPSTSISYLTSHPGGPLMWGTGTSTHVLSLEEPWWESYRKSAGGTLMCWWESTAASANIPGPVVKFNSNRESLQHGMTGGNRCNNRFSSASGTTSYDADASTGFDLFDTDDANAQGSMVLGLSADYRAQQTVNGVLLTDGTFPTSNTAINASATQMVEDNYTGWNGLYLDAATAPWVAIAVWRWGMNAAEMEFVARNFLPELFSDRPQRTGFVAAGAPAANPKGPLGMPFHGPLAGPIGSFGQCSI